VPARRPRLLYSLVLASGLSLLALGWLVFGTESDGSTQTYVEGIVGRPERPTPLFARNNTADRDLAALLFSGLTRVGGDGLAHPDLAERWEVSPDGLRYTFQLHEGLTWHDGTPLTSSDVTFTVAAVQAPGFQGLPSLAARWAGITVEARDERTVTFRLPAPAPSFLTLASLGVVPRHLLDGRDAAALLEAPVSAATVGAGPFRLARLDVTRAVLEPNLRYPAGPPVLQRLELRFYADDAALVAGLRRGDVDGALLGDTPSREALAAVVAREDLRATPLVEASYPVLYINNQREPLDQPPLRRALAASIDRAGLVPADSPALPGDGPILPGSWAYTPGGWHTSEQADALYAAAGWPRGDDGVRQRGGQPLTLELLTNDESGRVALAERVASQLRTQGVGVTMRAIPAGTLLRSHIDTREYDLLLFGWLADADPDPFGGWHTSQIASGGRNVAGFHDVEADELMEAARRTVDMQERRELYARWQGRFVELTPSLVLLHPRRLYVQPRDLQGTTAGVLFDLASRFHDVRQWHVAGTES
jgi:peptide/nickel transport system substrate-binding protein